VNDQVSGWAKRCYSKFAELSDNSTLKRQPEDLVKIFSAMELITVGELKSLRERGEDLIEPEDNFGEF